MQLEQMNLEGSRVYILVCVKGTIWLMKFELKQQCNFNVTKSFPDTTNPVFVQVGIENSFD